MGRNTAMIWYCFYVFFPSLDITVYNIFITHSLNGFFFQQNDPSGYHFDGRTIGQEPEHHVPCVKGEDFPSGSLVVQCWFMQ